TFELRSHLRDEPGPRFDPRRGASGRAWKLHRRPPVREDLMRRARVLFAAILATLLWLPQSIQETEAIYCYPGDPHDVYQACLAYNQGIGQQVNNQKQLRNISRQIKSTVAQINAIDAMIDSLNRQIAAQQALIVRTQASIDDLNKQIRFGQAALIPLEA